MKNQKFSLRKKIAASLLLSLLVTIIVYQPGLSGPFIFDDTVHISHNKQVQIIDLSWSSLTQASNSSLARPPWHRPLAQLTFGINHAITGLSTLYFKATNLAIHLSIGIIIFIVSRLLLLASLKNHKPTISDSRIMLFALVVSSIWLLHPLNLSTVLYTVQRMTQISALFVLFGIGMYTSGRLTFSENGKGIWRMCLAFPISGIGLLAKENAALFPLIILICELTLFRGLQIPKNATAIVLIRTIGIFLPLLLGVIYLISHPSVYDYAGRPFTLEERLFTESRVLWFYLQLIFSPTQDALGLFHDDFITSKSIIDPINTIFSVIAWAITLVLALVYSAKKPLICFSILFFLAAHAMESSFIPLEMIFEHRNYLASIGPIMALSYLITIAYTHKSIDKLLITSSALIIVTFATLTYLRAYDWRNSTSLTLTEVNHHPESPRANFKAAQLYIGLLNNSESDSVLYTASRTHLEKILEIDPGNPNSLFALIILNLHTKQRPEQEWLNMLIKELRDGDIGPTRLSVSQFSFLVRWHINKNFPLSTETMHNLFNAVLSSKRINKFGRSSILSARRAYFDKVLNQPELALIDAREAANLWPSRWHYQKKLAELAFQLNYFDEAVTVLTNAIQHDLSKQQKTEAESLLKVVQKANINKQ